MTPKIRNKTKVKESDHKNGEYEGRCKLVWKSQKNNSGIVPMEVSIFVKEILEGIGEVFFPNVSFRGLADNLRFYYFIPTWNIVLDYIEGKETEKENQESEEKREFCKRNKLKRITISKFNYKNFVSKLND